MANSEQVAALIDQAEALLAERYNADLDGDLRDAVAALRASATPGALARMEALMTDRELFRWREPADAALAALRVELGVEPVPEVEPPADDESEGEDVSRLTVVELRDRLNDRGITIPAGANKADLIELLDEGAAE